jgi:hypothetical protein
MKNKLKTEYAIFRKEVTWVEYAFWWFVRIVILYALVESAISGDPDNLVLRLSAKLVVSFLLPLIHLLPKSIFLVRLSYRTQTIVAVMLFLTAVLGQYKGFYNTVEWFDAYLHLFGCFVCVFAGYELTVALPRDRQPLSPVVAAVSGFGFSFFFAAGWEVFEFVSDTLIAGGNSQNWAVINSQQLLSLFSDIDPQRYALLDTMTDLMFGGVGSIVGGIVLFVYLCRKNKKVDSGSKVL